MLIPILQTIPIELLLAIFSYACTDGGQTGCTLNLVSRVFRRICLDTAADIRVVALCGVYQLESFLKLLCGRPETKRKVMSLFMSYRRDGNGQRESLSDGKVLILDTPP